MAHTIPPAEPEEPQPGFEASLRSAEQLVSQLESGQLDLDAALAAYESGVKLLARCHALLDAAELRVRLLQQGPGTDDPPQDVPFPQAGIDD